MEKQAQIDYNKDGELSSLLQSYRAKMFTKEDQFNNFRRRFKEAGIADEDSELNYSDYVIKYNKLYDELAPVVQESKKSLKDIGERIAELKKYFREKSKGILQKGRETVLPVIVNIQNPKIINNYENQLKKDSKYSLITFEETDNPTNTSDELLSGLYSKFKEDSFKALNNAVRVAKDLGKYDSLIFKGIADFQDYLSNTFVVFNPEKTHILGSKQDIEGFKQFVTKDSSNPLDVAFEDCNG